MLERLNYNNFKNLAEDTARFTYNTMQQCGYGLIAGSIVAVLSPSPSNLPSWAIDTLSKTNNTAITYLKNHLDATYVVAPAVGSLVFPLTDILFRKINYDKLTEGQKIIFQYAKIITMSSSPVLGSIICSRLGYDMHPIEVLFKGFFVPAFTRHAAEQFLDAAFPLPKEKPEASETVTA